MQICVLFLLGWDEIKEVRPEEYKKIMKNAIVYDGRNLYDIDEMKKSGVEYYSIGR